MAATIKDDEGRDYEIEDVLAFQRHLKEFHHAEGTIHSENGRCFTVTDELRKRVDELAKSAEG